MSFQSCGSDLIEQRGDILDGRGWRAHHVGWLLSNSFRRGGEESLAPRREERSGREVVAEKFNNTHNKDDNLGETEHLVEKSVMRR